MLKFDQRIVGLDNFATEHQRNLDEAHALVGLNSGVISSLSRVMSEIWAPRKTSLSENPISLNQQLTTVISVKSGVFRGAHMKDCQRACKSAEYVLHQAAMGSDPRSLTDPINANAANVTGFLNMLLAARDANVMQYVCAASSSTYGSHPGFSKGDDVISKPLSPYAITKYVNELYADGFGGNYGTRCMGVRYFNVFVHRQAPNGAYAAVIPKWTASMIRGESVFINGDGEISLDFCFIANVVQANLLAATTQNADALNQVHNVAVGDRTTLNELYAQLRRNLLPLHSHLQGAVPVYRDFRAGDVRHSLADISKACCLPGYARTQRIGHGIEMAMPWYVQNDATAARV